ncbi:MAG: hypothetical protein AWT59_2539 [Candidatus Gallionella acididurans]|uniref:Uncharacterized protein n=1 Tax=Candidatus Gallionella acididurans TaxID=1796491 RepID=A0A139BQQ1_9PROT|nr:MAG: hypothetical protein AWT59_2539 [Candidatus Gallionella acididurans]
MLIAIPEAFMAVADKQSAIADI